MKKTKLLIPLTAALLALASCGSPVANSSAGASADASTSQVGGSSQPGGDSSTQPGGDSSSQPGGGTQSSSADPQVPTTPVLFAAVKDSPKNALTKESLLEYINRAIGIINDFLEQNSAYHRQEPHLLDEVTADQLNQFLASEGAAFINGLMSNSRLTGDEIDYAFAAMGTIFLELLNIDKAMTEAHAPNSALYQYIFTDKVILEVVAKYLKQVELDHLFKTILDTNGAFEAVLGFMVGGNRGQAMPGVAVMDKLEADARAALPNDPVFAAVTELNNIKPIERELPRVSDYIDADLLFAAIRLVKDAYLALDEVGFDKFLADYSAIMEETAKTQGGPSQGGQQVQPQAPDYGVFINAAKDVAAVLKLLNYPVSDYDALIDAYFDAGLRSMDVNSVPTGNYFTLNNKTETEKTKEAIAKFRKICSGNIFKAAIDLFSALTGTVLPADIDDLSQGKMDAAFARVEEAYAKLSSEEKAAINSFLGYADLSVEKLFEDFRAAKGATDEEKARAQMEVLQNFSKTLGQNLGKAFSSSYGISYGSRSRVYVGDQINKEAFDLSLSEYPGEGQPIYHKVKNFTLVSGDTSKAGYIDVEFKATFEGIEGEYEFTGYNILVYPAALKTSYVIENARFSDDTYEYCVRDDGSTSMFGAYLMHSSEHVSALEFDFNLYNTGEGRRFSNGEGEGEAFAKENIPVSLTLAPIFYDYHGDSAMVTVSVPMSQFIGDGQEGFKTLDVDGRHLIYFLGNYLQ